MGVFWIIATASPTGVGFWFLPEERAVGGGANAAPRRGTSIQTMATPWVRPQQTPALYGRPKTLAAFAPKQADWGAPDGACSFLNGVPTALPWAGSGLHLRCWKMQILIRVGITRQPRTRNGASDSCAAPHSHGAFSRRQKGPPSGDERPFFTFNRTYFF